MEKTSEIVSDANPLLCTARFLAAIDRVLRRLIRLFSLFISTTKAHLFTLFLLYSFTVPETSSSRTRLDLILLLDSHKFDG